MVKVLEGNKGKKLFDISLVNDILVYTKNTGIISRNRQVGLYQMEKSLYTVRKQSTR